MEVAKNFWFDLRFESCWPSRSELRKSEAPEVKNRVDYKRKFKPQFFLIEDI